MGDLVRKHQLELAAHQVPVLAACMPMLLDALCGQVKHPAQGIVVGKAGLVFRDLTELMVEALDDIGRVYDLPDLGRVFIKRAQNVPIFLPALHAGGVLFPPRLPELEQGVLRLFQGHGGVNFFQAGHYLFDVLIADETGGRADLVDDTSL